MRTSILILVVTMTTLPILADKPEATERFFKGLGGKGMDGLSGLPIGSYPLWKFHKFDGLSLKPVPIGLELGAGIPPPPPQYMNSMPIPYEGGQGGYGPQQQQQSYGGPPPSYQPPAYQPQQSYQPPPPSYSPPQSNYGGGGYNSGYSSQPKCKTVCDDQYGNAGYSGYSSQGYSPAPPPSYGSSSYSPSYSSPPPSYGSSSYSPPPSYGQPSSYSPPPPAYPQSYSSPPPSYTPYQQSQPAYPPASPQTYQQSPPPADYQPAPQIYEQPQPQYSAPVYEQQPQQQYSAPSPPPQQSYGPPQQPAMYDSPPPAPTYNDNSYKKRRSSTVHGEKLKDVIKERSDSNLEIKTISPDNLQN